MAEQSADMLSIYTPKSKLQIADVPLTVDYSIIRNEPSWAIVKLSQPMVPVWLSSSYARVENGYATVTANRLNLRIRPSLQSRVLTIVTRGYRSKVLKEGNEFLQIQAPHWVPYAIKSSDLARMERLQADRASNSPAQLTQNEAVSSSKGRSENDLTTQSTVTPTPPQPELTSSDLVSSASTKPLVRSTSQSSEGIIGGESEKNAAKLRVVPQNESVIIAQQHLLAPGDAISLQVFGEGDLSLANVRIPQSGLVSFPLIGSVNVAGKTTEEIEAIVKQTLSKGYIKNPRLSVTIESYRPVFVKGGIQSIGAFPYTEGLTVAKAIALAGGTKNSALENGISITRDGAVINDQLSLDSQFQVLSGDIISVAEERGVEESTSSYVYLHGEVTRPGEYQFRRGLTVEKAIVLAGGFTLRASRKKITLSRIVEGQEEPEVTKKTELYSPVMPGDIIDIGASWF